MPDANDLKGLEDLGKEEIFDRKDKKKAEQPELPLREGEPTIRVVNRRKQGVVVIKSKMSAKDKAKFKNLPGASVVVVKKPRSEKSRKLPDHIRKACITINDKDMGNPVKVVFEGDWVPSDINLAGKFLILDFQSFVRNRAMKGR